MARKQKNTKDLLHGFRGWEKQYIKKSIAYGHLQVGTHLDSKAPTKKRG